MAKKKAVVEDVAPELTEGQQTVKDAEEKVAEVKAAVAELQPDYDKAVAAVKEAQAELDAANKALEPVPEKGVHILVDLGGNGDYALRDLPEEYKGVYPRSLRVDGHNVEQVGEHESGVRHYRKM